VSDYIASFFAYSSANVKTIYDGVEVKKFSQKTDRHNNRIRREFNIGNDVFLVGMVAQLTPRKGHKDFIKAASLVKKVLPEVKFLVVGDAILDKGMSLNDLKRYAKEIKADNVIFTGQRNDRVNIFHALDCFVLPSHIEPFAGVIMEAMAASVPVIATKSGGAVEIIRDYENGLLIPAKSPETMADRIVELVKDLGLAGRLRKKAFYTVSKHFDVSTCVKKVERAYDEIFKLKKDSQWK
jgi:glycosyltransferase involved in cell wall biosynthesis